MVKHLSKQQVDDLIKLKFGRLVTSNKNKQYVSNGTLSKIFGVSATRIRQLYMDRFQAIADEQLPFLERLTKRTKRYPRKRWGLRFLKAHEIAWSVSK